MLEKIFNNKGFNALAKTFIIIGNHDYHYDKENNISFGSDGIIIYNGRMRR